MLKTKKDRNYKVFKIYFIFLSSIDRIYFSLWEQMMIITILLIDHQPCTYANRDLTKQCQVRGKL